MRAQLDGAKWNLDKTVVRAPPAAGVTNLALRKDARVASVPLAPVMAFIDTSDTIIGVTVQQFDARYGVFMTGPSATADIEGVLIHGAHGIRTLTVILTVVA